MTWHLLTRKKLSETDNFRLKFISLHSEFGITIKAFRKDMIQTVVKRDGRIAGFNEQKIMGAIRKAMIYPAFIISYYY